MVTIPYCLANKLNLSPELLGSGAGIEAVLGTENLEMSIV